MKFNKICVLGLGYIGLPTASTFATHGLEVVGVDVNPNVIDTLRKGDLHIHEPGLRTLVGAALGSGNLRISDHPEPADAYIIAVPTPFLADKRADLAYVRNAANSIINCLSTGELVVLESTSPPRTTLDVVAPILEKSGLNVGQDFHLAYSPERVLPGQILRELIDNARVIGGIDSRSSEAGRDLYQIFVRGEIILTDATTAEMIKLMENTYRDVNIAIANEFSRLADRFGVDIWQAITTANRHPRVEILCPGPGVGGHCISVDPWFLVEAAPDITPLIRTARRVNDAQPEFVVDLIRQGLGFTEEEASLANKQIAILGITYKRNVDDWRESPAITVVKLLQDAGATISVYDPFVEDRQVPGINIYPDLESTLSEADLIALMVAHTTFEELIPEKIAEMTSARKIVDAVNGWHADSWIDAGFSLTRLGVGS